MSPTHFSIQSSLVGLLEVTTRNSTTLASALALISITVCLLPSAVHRPLHTFALSLALTYKYRPPRLCHCERSAAIPLIGNRLLHFTCYDLALKSSTLRPACWQAGVSRSPCLPAGRRLPSIYTAASLWFSIFPEQLFEYRTNRSRGACL